MDYTQLTEEQRRQVVAQRLAQFEQQHLLATVNAAAAKAAGEPAQADTFAKQAAQWEASAVAVRAILAAMPQSDPAALPKRAMRVMGEPA